MAGIKYSHEFASALTREVERRREAEARIADLQEQVAHLSALRDERHDELLKRTEKAEADALKLETTLTGAAIELEEARAENDQLRTVCAETYQVVGVLGDLNNPGVVKALDNLSAAADGKPIPHSMYCHSQTSPPMPDQPRRARELGKRDGLRFTVTWLHNRANSMNDLKARAILNSAAYDLGCEIRDMTARMESDQPRPQSDDDAQRRALVNECRAWLRDGLLNPPDQWKDRARVLVEEIDTRDATIAAKDAEIARLRAAHASHLISNEFLVRAQHLCTHNPGYTGTHEAMQKLINFVREVIASPQPDAIKRYSTNAATSTETE